MSFKFRCVLAPAGHPPNPFLLFSNASFALSLLQTVNLHPVKGKSKRTSGGAPPFYMRAERTWSLSP